MIILAAQFEESHEMYNNIVYFLQDFMEKELKIPMQDCIVAIQYDNSTEIKNELFIVDYNEYYGMNLSRLESRDDIISDHKVIKILGIRTIKDPDKFIEV